MVNVSLGLAPFEVERWDGASVKRLRLEIGWTQEQLAHALGTTFSTVNRWENSHAKPSRVFCRCLNELQARADDH